MIKIISSSLILFYTLSFSQNKNNTNYFPPEKLENKLGQTFLLNTYYSLLHPETGFSINSPLSFVKVYEEFPYEQNPHDAKELLAEIHFNKLGKLNSVKKYPDNGNSIIIYNEKGLISFIIDQNKEYNNIAEFEYNEIGNLISQYNYYKREQGLEFHSYTEYKYYLENGNTVVQEFKIEKYTGSAVERNKITFDKQQRMTTEERSLYIPNKKQLNYKRSYYYDNLKFPQKITKKETYNLVGNNKELELFEYNDNGNLIKSYINSEPQKLIISEKNTYLSKNEVEKIIIIKEPNRKEEKRHNLITLDDSGNIIYDKEISENKDNNFFTKNSYKFDNHKNWTELLIQQHNYLVEEGGKDDESADEYIKYIREINYSDFEEMHSPKIVDTKASEQLKKEKLEKSKYYEQIKNMK